MDSPSESTNLKSEESPPPPSPTSSDPPPSNGSSTTTDPKRLRGRDANVYDAVAGRITLNNALSDADDPISLSSRRRRTSAGRHHSARNAKLAPEEALFRRKHAPARYAEYDIYWASDDLPSRGGGRDDSATPVAAAGGSGSAGVGIGNDDRDKQGRRHHPLPDSDLLRSVHWYASHFYEATALRLGGVGDREGKEGENRRGRNRCFVGSRLVDERSMDETALLAFGVLLEEAGRAALGKSGDTVFTEASMEHGNKGPAAVAGRFGSEPGFGLGPGPDTGAETSIRFGVGQENVGGIVDQATPPGSRRDREPKRRKVAKQEQIGD
ncbi:hypothetical protein B0J18DRAFT_123334 [Chaetomium sp. MPI-SDFR-AT-0129]|nr:hypothetical protein B0J18DRAFT_123334 [Chaetomium sp. MPI-SDFR-AT-0129]